MSPTGDPNGMLIKVATQKWSMLSCDRSERRARKWRQWRLPSERAATARPVLAGEVAAATAMRASGERAAAAERACGDGRERARRGGGWTQFRDSDRDTDLLLPDIQARDKLFGLLGLRFASLSLKIALALSTKPIMSSHQQCLSVHHMFSIFENFLCATSLCSCFVVRTNGLLYIFFGIIWILQNK